MKKFWVGLGILVLVVLAIIIVITTIGKRPESYKIGVILPLTGSAAYIGENVKMGMELAKKEINNRGGIKGTSLRLLFEDSINDPKTGVSAYRKLLTTKNLNVMCVAMSTVTKSIIPLADRDKMPILATVVSAEGIAGQSPWIFRFFTRADVDAKAMAEYAYQELKLRKVAIIHIQDDFGISYTEVFKRTIELLGGSIPIVENYYYGETDFRTQLTKIKPLQPDGVYVVSYANNMALIPKQMRELGIDATILSVGTISQSFVVQQAPDVIEGAYYTTNAFNTFHPQTNEMKKFVVAFESIYGKKPEYFEVFGYDTIYLIAEAIERKDYFREGIKEGLLSIQAYKGAAGEIFVTEEGEVNFPIIVARVVNGRPSLPLLQVSPHD